MTFKEALKKLNIEDYGTKIFNSNSRGELFHLTDYIILAEILNDPDWFREWFIGIIKEAEKKWNRPASVYQHILKLFRDALEPFPTAEK